MFRLSLSSLRSLISLCVEMTWKLNLFPLRGELEKEARWATDVTAKDRSRQTFLFLLLKIASPCGIKAKKKKTIAQSATSSA